MDLGDAAAGDAGDLAVQFDEGAPERVGEHPSERGLAGAAQADQGDALHAIDRIAVRAEQSGQMQSRAPQVGFVTAIEHVADQQPFGRRRGDIPQKRGQRTLERQRDLLQDEDGCVARARFEIGEMSLGDPSAHGERPAGQPAAGADRPDALGEDAEEGSVRCGIGLAGSGPPWRCFPRAGEGFRGGARGHALLCMFRRRRDSWRPGPCRVHGGGRASIALPASSPWFYTSPWFAASPCAIATSDCSPTHGESGSGVTVISRRCRGSGCSPTPRIRPHHAAPEPGACTSPSP